MSGPQLLFACFSHTHGSYFVHVTKYAAALTHARLSVEATRDIEKRLPSSSKKLGKYVFLHSNDVKRQVQAVCVCVCLQGLCVREVYV